MNTITGRSINDLSYCLLYKFQQFHHTPALNERTKRSTLDLGPTVSILENPTRRVLSLYNRQSVIAATLYEAIWILAGRNDVKELSYFLPRAFDFSDDGETWRAGYGPRLRDYAGQHDQMVHVISHLQDDPSSRQAVITIIDPRVDLPAQGKTKDFPCTNLVYFKIRDGKLDCEVIMRSNDVLWGFQHINVFEWTLIQEVIANSLKVPVGRYHHYSSSMHLYGDHVDRLNQIMSGPRFDAYDFVDERREPVSELNYQLADSEASRFFHILPVLISFPETTDIGFDSLFFSTAWSVIRSFVLLKHANSDSCTEPKAQRLCEHAIDFAMDAKQIAYRIAALEYAVRSINKNKYLGAATKLAMTRTIEDLCRQDRPVSDFVTHSIAPKREAA